MLNAPLLALWLAACPASAKEAPAAKPAAPDRSAAVAALRQRLRALAVRPQAPQVTLREGFKFPVKIDQSNLPDYGINGSSKPGTKLSAVYHGVSIDGNYRVNVSPGSVLYGQVIESTPFQKDPFQEARLRLHFYRLYDAFEKTSFPINAVVDSGVGYPVTSSGTVLGNPQLILFYQGGDADLVLRLLEPLQMHLAQDWRFPVFDGTPTGDSLRVDQIPEVSAARQEGLLVGDEILSVDGVSLAEANVWKLLAGPPLSRVKVAVRRPGKDKPIKLSLARGAYAREALGLHLTDGSGRVWIEWVAPGSPADKAKVPEGARLLAVDGSECASSQECARLIILRKGSLISLRLESADKEFDVSLRAARFIEAPFSRRP
ncbi:MAG: PDZ domain-containing protein [Elusimicrobia bacterium]|nr:PDZ domain-containing protein [Elusimicrobiota bacterium]